MTTRTSSKIVIFDKPFSLKGVDQTVPAGNYRVDTDEELLEGVSFVAYRRVSTVMFLPVKSRRGSSVEMVNHRSLGPSGSTRARRRIALRALRLERLQTTSAPARSLASVETIGASLLET
jgi:hypothetical protein